jgi:hypothetical protein
MLLAAACTSGNEDESTGNQLNGSAAGAASGAGGVSATAGNAGTQAGASGSLPEAGSSIAIPPSAGASGTSGMSGSIAGASGTDGDSSGTLPTLDADTPFRDVPAACRGIELEGLTHSPGGSTLPNVCAPFHGTYNNPYAIRCIDADPSYASGYPGDAFCILPPPPELGTQLRIGPDDYAVPGSFELAAGAEISNYYNLDAPTTEAHHYYRTNWRMRPGGHHMLIAMLNSDQSDGWAAFGEMGSEFGGRSRSFGGAQRPDVDRPQGTLEVPEENRGLGQELAARQQFSINLHSVNPTTEPVLREVWINVWYMAASEVMHPIDTVALMGSPGDMAVPAGQSLLAEYSCSVGSPTRIISLYGHYHANDKHFSAWVERASGERVAVYDSFAWEDIPVYQYDSLSMNPVANTASRLDGAMSGLLELSAGDRLHFSCDIVNESSQALRFADEATTGEMCILFGAYTGPSPCARVQRVQ